MTNSDIRQLALDISALIKRHGVEFHKFAINVTITEEYYQQVKDTLQ